VGKFITYAAVDTAWKLICLFSTLSAIRFFRVRLLSTMALIVPQDIPGQLIQKQGRHIWRSCFVVSALFGFWNYLLWYGQSAGPSCSLVDLFKRECFITERNSVRERLVILPIIYFNPTSIMTDKGQGIFIVFKIKIRCGCTGNC